MSFLQGLTIKVMEVFPGSSIGSSLSPQTQRLVFSGLEAKEARKRTAGIFSGFVPLPISVALFDSHARGEHTPISDFCIVTVLKGPRPGMREGKMLRYSREVLVIASEVPR